MAFVRGLLGDQGPKHRLRGKAILELGSFNVNGTVRTLIGQPGRYVGVDWRAGPCVDHVSLFHDIPWTAEFDLLISCNALEHDPHWRQSLAVGMRALKPGGEIILCAAGPGYPVHELASAPVEGHYENIEAEALARHMDGCGADGVTILFTEPPDVTFHGYKRSLA